MTDPRLGEFSGGYHEPLKSTSGGTSEAQDRAPGDVWAHVPDVEPAELPDSAPRRRSRSNHRPRSGRPMAVWAVGVAAVFVLLMAVIVVNGRRQSLNSPTDELASWTTPGSTNEAMDQFPGAWQSPSGGTPSWNTNVEGTSGLAAQTVPPTPWQQASTPSGVAGQYAQPVVGVPQPWAYQPNEMANWNAQPSPSDAVSAQGWGATESQTAASLPAHSAWQRESNVYPPASGTPPLWQQGVVQNGNIPPGATAEFAVGQRAQQPGTAFGGFSDTTDYASQSAQAASYVQQYRSGNTLPSAAEPQNDSWSAYVANSRAPAWNTPGTMNSPSQQIGDTWSNAAATRLSPPPQPTYPVAGQSRPNSLAVGGNNAGMGLGAPQSGAPYSQGGYGGYQQSTTAGAAGQRTEIAGLGPNAPSVGTSRSAGQSAAMRVTTVWPPADVASGTALPSVPGEPGPLGGNTPGAAFHTADARAAAGLGTLGRAMESPANAAAPPAGGWPTNAATPNTASLDAALQPTGMPFWGPLVNSGTATAASQGAGSGVNQSNYGYPQQQYGVQSAAPTWQQPAASQKTGVLRTTNPWYPGNTGEQQQSGGNPAYSGLYGPAPTGYTPMVTGQGAWQ